MTAAIITGESTGDARLAGMVYVPAGEFPMGDDRYARERPARMAQVDGFWIDRYLVTNAEFKAFVDAGGIEPPLHWAGGTYRDGQHDHPAEINWVHARAYADAHGKRLPTEMQWEKAARGPAGLEYPWGNEFDAVRCLTWETSAVTGAHSEPVAARPQGASPYGCEQMVGLCEEWCEDDYDAYPGADYSSVGYGVGMKVLRGGSWIFPMTHARGSYRCFESPDLDTTGYGQLGGPGFRCVLLDSDL